MRDFDLIEYQQIARTTASAQRLFELWNDTCTLYEQGRINKLEFEELRDLIYPNLQALGFLRDIINESTEEVSTASTDATNTKNDDSDFISAKSDDETGASGD